MIPELSAWSIRWSLVLRVFYCKYVRVSFIELTPIMN